MGCRPKPADLKSSHSPPQSLQYLSLRTSSPEVNLPLPRYAQIQPLSKLSKTKRIPSQKDRFTIGHRSLPLALGTAANGADYTDEAGAEQNETTGFGDRSDGKGNGLIVGMLSIRSENVRVGAGGGEIAL
jgi:hypothetical protein